MKLRTTISLRPHELLYAWRRTNKVSQAQVAKDFGFHQTAISKMESGVIPVNDIIEREAVIRKKDIPDWVFLGIARRRRGIKMGTAARETGIPTHVLGDMEHGRVRDISKYEEYLKL